MSTFIFLNSHKPVKMFSAVSSSFMGGWIAEQADQAQAPGPRPHSPRGMGPMELIDQKKKKLI